MILKFKYLFILAVVGFALSSCVTARKVNYMQEPDRYIPHYADTLSFEDYQLRIGDRLYVYVYSIDQKVMQMYNAGGSNASQMRQQMSHGGTYGSYDLYTYLIDEEGNIDFPVVGTLPLGGMTTKEAEALINAQSGRYMINKEKMTIFEALAMAGDLGEFNSRKEIKIVREKDGVTTIKTFDARSKEIVNSEFYYIEPNDIIYIRQIPGYSFGINHVTTVIGVTAATISFGVFIYSIVQTGINHVNKYYGKGASK